MRQALAAVLFRAGQRAPATVSPGPVNGSPAVRCLHRVIGQAATLLVADLGNRRYLLGRESPGLRKDGVDDVVAELGKRSFRQHIAKAGDMPQRKGDLLDWRLVHRTPPLASAASDN